jgi:hypothetical protein
VVYLEAPGCWARMAIHERSLLPLLHDLAVERLATDLVGSVGYPQEAILAVLGLMNWSGLIDISEHESWSGHDLLFHVRTRRGYARSPLGKRCVRGKIADQAAPKETADYLR